MNRPSILSILLASRVESPLPSFWDNGFLHGLKVAGYNLDAPMPLYGEVITNPDGTGRILKSDVVRMFSDLLVHLRHKEFIMAIKAVREVTGLGLKEAKDVIDAFRALMETGPNGTTR